MSLNDRCIKVDNLTVDPLYEGLFHRPGCSIQRNDRCICAYMAQWDRPGYTAPTFRDNE